MTYSDNEIAKESKEFKGTQRQNCMKIIFYHKAYVNFTPWHT